jgi:hypothetical protein
MLLQPSEGIDLDAIRARLRTMTDAALESAGRAVAYMASPDASYGTPRQTWAARGAAPATP